MAPPRRWVVVLDPGHGGKNSGLSWKRSGDVSEKTLLLQLAQTVKTNLRRQAAVNVFLTRRRDEPLSILERITLANRKGADVFVSLHLAGAPSSRFTPPRIFVNRLIRDPVINKIVKQHKSAGIVAVPWDLAQNDQIKYSLRLGQDLRTAWNRVEREGSAPAADLISGVPVAVLSGLASPGILLEVSPPDGNLNPENMEADYIKPQAQWIARGILRFIRSR